MGTIHLPGNGGFADYLVIAPTGHTLYAGYATANALVVIDTEKNKFVTSIGGLGKCKCKFKHEMSHSLFFSALTFVNREGRRVWAHALTHNKR